jgi:hypothetical protein
MILIVYVMTLTEKELIMILIVYVMTLMENKILVQVKKVDLFILYNLLYIYLY